MAPYTRPQLWVLLAITILGGLGVAVGHWRRAHPDLTERIERFDASYAGVPAAGARADPAPERVALTDARARSRGTTAPVVTRASDPGTRVDGGPRWSPSRSAGRSRKRQATEGPVDLNRATVQDLGGLPGVGPALARRIVASREQTGRFGSVDDLRRVTGLGPGRLGRLRGLVTVSE